MAILDKVFGLSVGVALSALLLAGGATAGGFTIVDGQTVTTTQYVFSPGDVGVIQAGGKIDAPDFAIQLDQDDTDVINDGSVSGAGIGILVFSYFNTITNSGLMTGAFGIDSIGGFTTVKNSGTIAGSSIGIYGDFYNNITNSGKVTGFDAIDIGNFNTIDNSGKVIAGHLGLHVNNLNAITNSGLISGDFGIVANFENTMVNSGTILGTAKSVWFSGPNNTLTLLKGSNIQGLLDLGNSSNKLVIGPGLNTALAYAGSPTISSVLPFVLHNNTVSAVDVTGFSVQDGLANQLTEVVTDAVDDRLDSVRRAQAGFSTAMGSSVVHAASSNPQADASGFWLSGLGSYRHLSGNGTTTIDSTAALGGLLIGRDGMISTHTRAGGFAGSSVSGLHTQDDSQDLNTTSVLGGLYLGHDMGLNFVDASLTFGHSAFDSQRHVLNNLVAGGIETATGDYGGWMVSPSVKLGTSRFVQGGTLTPSLALRYTGLMLDGYTETGSSANLSVGGRGVNVFDARAALAYALTPRSTEHGTWSPTLQVGVDGNASSQSDINASLFGQSLDFAPASSNAVRGFAGLDVNVQASHGASLTLSTEAGYDTNKSFTGKASASFDLRF